MVGFKGFLINPDGLSNLPFHFVRPEDKPAFDLLSEIILLETAPRLARKNWQVAQLANLIDHARQRSPFWRERLAPSLVKRPKLSKIPILTRNELRKQVAAEGSLLATQDGAEVKSHATSGSTGTVVEFFVTEANKIYNEIRSFTQLLLEGRDTSLNRCRLRINASRRDLQVRKADNYSGYLSHLFPTGKYLELDYFDMDPDNIIREFERFKPHQLVCGPHFFEAFIRRKGAAVLSEVGIREVITFGQHMSSYLIEQLQEAGIRHTSNYSCEEVGPIAWECQRNKGHFHVCESNVILEIGEERELIDGAICGNVLVTGLHSYATPFIRYELGDYAQLLSACPCGYEGPVLTHLIGRIASTLKLPDGTRRPFNVTASRLRKIINYSDLRIRQIDTERITVEIATANATHDQIERTKDWFSKLIGPNFRIEFSFTHEIDWGLVRKRNQFLNLLD